MFCEKVSNECLSKVIFFKWERNLKAELELNESKIYVRKFTKEEN